VCGARYTSGADGGEAHRECFVLLERAIEAAKGNPALKEKRAHAKKLLEVPGDIVESLISFTDSDSLMRAHRDAVARSIEALSLQQEE